MNKTDLRTNKLRSHELNNEFRQPHLFQKKDGVIHEPIIGIFIVFSILPSSSFASGIHVTLHSGDLKYDLPVLLVL